ncbi:PIR Superfamily Protein [Plasmodium ovale curtisi]|uniref:PIR Superfamily Protein n=1 Tax=Plasmodium ovale curtisi TaxID=864141 RepID=A0A1A8VVY9_PLAOA|nr:PIR Superfamily Protein [Plasmodium ovale curtisi]SBT02220.1 PIR Superfamily Protein [Plasmodium ovale curtisi]
MNSPGISTAYNVLSTYTKYKNEISRYNNEHGVESLPGCQSFNYENIDLTKEHFPQLCTTAIKFLMHLKVNSNTYRDEGCKYLYYSLYVEVLKRKTTFEDTLILYKKLNNLFNNEYDGMNILDIYINNMNKNTSDNLVKLIDIYELFDKFERESTSMLPKKNCTSDSDELFKGYLDDCRKGNDYDFCYELKNFREKYNTFIEKVIKCEGEQYLLPPVEMFNTASMIVAPSVIIVLTAFIFPVLYKYTEFGPWIQRRLGIKKNIWKNISEETNNSFNIYEMVDKKSKKRNYNIMYNYS